jgi:serine/threonine-protein kinase
VDALLWRRIGDLFDAARQRKGEERAEFLREQCGDDQSLLEQILSLLDADNLHGPLDSRPTISSLPVPDIVAGRFRIVRYVAEGGMGTVYEAEDLQLHERVALKTIRADVASDPKAVERFKREIHLGKSVTHPNVCRIHDLVVDRSEAGTEVLFLSMQFLNGETLASRIGRGPVPKIEAMPLIEDVADALSAAHEAGVIHRDFKSGNVMLVQRADRTRAVITDFGLARAVRDNDLKSRTRMAGTVDYMAPEQIRGDKLTPAADIYALGVVMYEMVTGRLPFTGDSKVTVALKHLNDEPQPPRDLAPHLEPNWNDTILGCLRKSPRERFQSAGEVKVALVQNGAKSRSRPTQPLAHRIMSVRSIGLTAGTLMIALTLFGFLHIPAIGERVRGILFSSSEKHIAVLPLDFVSGNPETQALGDGLMDSLTGRLSNLDVANKALWVVPASEVHSRKVNDPSSARREFGATIVVKGSFERSNAVARLRLNLIDPKNMREIGFVDVESQSGDLAALQDEAVTRLGRLLNISVGEDLARGSERPATRPAYEDYLAGVGYFQRHDKPSSIELAITALQSAVDTDPHFALGFARLAQVYVMKYRLNSNPEWLKKAEGYAKQAAELDNGGASTYVALGQVHELTGNHDLAIEEYQRAVNLDPRDSEAIAGMANAYKNAGRNADAEAAYIKAAALRPNDWKGYNDLGIFYESIGRPRDAIVQLNHALQLTPDNSWPYTNLAMAYMDLDDPKMLGEAENALKKSITISPTFGAYGNLGFLYAEQHRFRESVAASQAALKLNDQSYDVWANLAVAYEWLKDHERARSARRKAIHLLELALKLNPQNAEGQATLAALYAKEGFRDKALDGIHISLALSPNNQYVLAQIADAYELIGNRKEAIQYLQKAIGQGLTRGLLNEDPEIQGVISDPGFHIPGN